MLKDFTKEKFDIIIQAGQSNANGTAFGPADEPYTPDGRVWYMNENDTISLAVEKVNGNSIQSNFSLSFAREYIRAGRLAQGRKLLILRAAEGGTGFWNHYWRLGDDLYLHMMEMIRTALALNPENRLVALLWHQGENEVSVNTSFDQHYNQLNTLLQSVRNTFEVPELPFIAGDFVPQWKEKTLQASTPVSDAMRALCADCGHGGFAETHGLKSNAQDVDVHPLGWGNADDIHFSRRSIYELGLRYFREYARIVG